MSFSGLKWIFGTTLLFSLMTLSTAQAGYWVTERVDPSRFEGTASHEVELLRVTSDAAPGEETLKLLLDQDANILALRTYNSNSGARVAAEYSLEQLKEGVVLLKEGKYDVIKLVNRDADNHAGGQMTLVYLSNGISESYENFEMELKRVDESWKLFTNDQEGRREFTKMFLKKRTFFGKVVGIEKVVVS